MTCKVKTQDFLTIHKQSRDFLITKTSNNKNLPPDFGFVCNEKKEEKRKRENVDEIVSQLFKQNPNINEDECAEVIWTGSKTKIVKLLENGIWVDRNVENPGYKLLIKYCKNRLFVERKCIFENTKGKKKKSV